MNKIRYNNNYTISEEIFNDVLNWAADKNPTRTKEQVCSDIEKILNLIQQKGYITAKGTCCGHNS